MSLWIAAAGSAAATAAATAVAAAAAAAAVLLLLGGAVAVPDNNIHRCLAKLARLILCTFFCGLLPLQVVVAAGQNSDVHARRYSCTYVLIYARTYVNSDVHGRR